MNRSIIHINVADFAVAVEREVDCRLKGRPVIVAPDGAPRSAVYDMSEEAYQAGVRKHMLLRQAARICRDARILPPHPGRYERAMIDLLRQALPYTPLVEPGSGDGHLFLDISGTSRLHGPPSDVAWRLGKSIRSQMGLAPIWSLAPNKLVAKVASRLVKPQGEYIVHPGEEMSFLAPLSLDLLPGLESSDLQALREFNITRVFQALELNRSQLEVPFGTHAGIIYESLRGIDPSPVLPPGKTPPAIRFSLELGNDTNDPAVVQGCLYRLVEQAGQKLRSRRMAARIIGITLTYSDGVRRFGRVAVRPAASGDPTLFRYACTALQTAWKRRTRIRAIDLACHRLVFPPAQQALFAGDRQTAEKETRLMDTLDRVRSRFGDQSVFVGRTRTTRAA